jgi:hypothetical protein
MPEDVNVRPVKCMSSADNVLSTTVGRAAALCRWNVIAGFEINAFFSCLVEDLLPRLLPETMDIRHLKYKEKERF